MLSLQVIGMQGLVTPIIANCGSVAICLDFTIAAAVNQLHTCSLLSSCRGINNNNIMIAKININMAKQVPCLQCMSCISTAQEPRQ